MPLPAVELLIMCGGADGKDNVVIVELNSLHKRTHAAERTKVLDRALRSGVDSQVP